MLSSFIVAFEFCQFPRTAMMWHRLGINILWVQESQSVNLRKGFTGG